MTKTRWQLIMLLKSVLRSSVEEEVETWASAIGIIYSLFHQNSFLLVWFFLKVNLELTETVFFPIVIVNISAK